MMRSVSTVRLIERAVADDRSYYATGECKQAVAGLGRIRQVVHDGRDCSMGKQSVLTKVVVNARWSSMAGVAQNRFYCIIISTMLTTASRYVTSQLGRLSLLPSVGR